MSDLVTIVSSYKAADESIVSDFNNHAHWHGVGIEQQVVFLSERLLLAVSAIIQIGQALVDERTTDEAPPAT